MFEFTKIQLYKYASTILQQGKLIKESYLRMEVDINQKCRATRSHTAPHRLSHAVRAAKKLISRRTPQNEYQQQKISPLESDEWEQKQNDSPSLKFSAQSDLPQVEEITFGTKPKPTRKSKHIEQNFGFFGQPSSPKSESTANRGKSSRQLRHQKRMHQDNSNSIGALLSQFWITRRSTLAVDSLNYFNQGDLKTLQSQCALNDAIVNQYISILKKIKTDDRIKILNTYFLPKIKDLQKNQKFEKIERMLAKHGISSESILLLPIHWKRKRHWSFLKMERGRIIVYDSLPSKGRVWNSIKQFYKNVFGDECQVRVDKDFPKQEDGTLDCGVFMLNGLRSIVLNKSYENVFKEGVEGSRIRIAKEICMGKIIF